MGHEEYGMAHELPKSTSNPQGSHVISNNGQREHKDGEKNVGCSHVYQKEVCRTFHCRSFEHQIRNKHIAENSSDKQHHVDD